MNVVKALEVAAARHRDAALAEQEFDRALPFDQPHHGPVLLPAIEISTGGIGPRSDDFAVDGFDEVAAARC